MSSQAHLTELSRELCDMIYDGVLGSEGYMYNPDTGKLIQANGSPINLGLSLTYKVTRGDVRTDISEQTDYVQANEFERSRRCAWGKFW
jgi:hypothetical protein